jgi:hypothetical protein
MAGDDLLSLGTEDKSAKTTLQFCERRSSAKARLMPVR